jgi:hypothetical protein
MSTRKIVAAAVSVAIVASTFAMFQASSQVRFSTTVQATSIAEDGRPVTRLAPVTVLASPLPDATVGNLDIGSGAPQSGLALPSLDSGSQMSMPYYSFATNLQSIIKE